MVRACTIVAIVLFVSASCAFAQATADTVLYLIPGSGQNVGQGPAFFPSNVFGVPDPRATVTAPSVDPREICSIGLGGELVIGFKDQVVVNGPGVDVVVYENAFIYGSDRLYAEPARVELSRDGVDWIKVPFDSATLEGCVGVTPTTGMDPFDPTVSGGDGIDLEGLNIDSVKYIKLVDVSEIILNNSDHMYYDPTLSGADIDAVVGINTAVKPTETTLTVIQRSSSVEVVVSGTSAAFLVHDVSGRLLYEETLPTGIHTRDLSPLVITVGLVSIQSEGEVQTVKVLR